MKRDCLTDVPFLSRSSLDPDKYRPGQRLIYLVEENALSATDLATQLSHFGYEVGHVSQLDHLEKKIVSRMPSALILSMNFPAGVMAASREISRITQHLGYRFPTLLISTHGNLKSRLAAVRAGIDGYFTRPPDLLALIERLDALIAIADVQPYRILIIDDDIQTAEHCKNILGNAGMEVNILRKLTMVLDELDEFRPELILMSAAMPAFQGHELAKLIRQDSQYLDTPIVLLSNEHDIVKQLDAIQSGVDDFLIKPIQPIHLISSLSNRAERYRTLRGLIMRDSLTGLYNHSAIKDHLQRELSCAMRSGEPLAVAMIDLDSFKQTNDRHGHAAGDQVIRALSRLMQQRLRRSDLIGRYGGEEFVVILPRTAAAMAAGVIDQVRDIFSKIRHHSGESEFTSSFSTGIATSSEHKDGEALLRAADRALYRAKYNGRNRIELE
jgi:diguanylate cyclase (GGDEF)-like protein